MRRPSGSFIGTMIGLLLFLFAPFSLMPYSVDHPSKELIVCIMLYYSGLGAIIGAVAEKILRRHA